MHATVEHNLKLSFCTVGGALLLSVAMIGGARAQKTAVKQTTGEQTYKTRCASCHGVKGEGTKIRPTPLTGDRSVGDLAKYIAQSMPPGPKKCGGEDAKKVAAYIYNAFYSPVSQARNVPARVALSRLTVKQFRNSVADLIGSFREQPHIPTQHGLQAEYFKAKRFDNGERVVQRIDPEVKFDFGTNGPIADKFEPHQFSIRWQGSLIAPETGEYEIILHSEHAVRLWLNDDRLPLIDAWVKSGNDNEFHASLTLLGGRAYPLRLEFTKSTQGVDDTEKKKGTPPAHAAIALDWRRPHEAEETIPNRCLTPDSSPETYVTATPFPPDDRSIGYERGNSVSKAWDEATTTAALEAASYVTEHLRDLSHVPDEAPDRPARLQAFCRKFVERAFRRPIPPDVARLYVERQFSVAPDPTLAVKRVVVLTLKSPRFLYQEAGDTTPDGYDIAARLSFTLWDSLPDQELLRAAAAGELCTRDQVKRQAERMVADPRAALKVHDFFMQWLKVDQVPELAKDSKRFPGFDPTVATDLRTSLELEIESIVWSDKSDYRELMLSDKTFLNGRLAGIYGVKLPPDAPFQPVALDPAERAGVLTHPYIMASFAYVDNSSPIHRGVMIVRNMLGRVLKPPPAAFAPLAASLHPDLTTRQRVEMQTKPAACNGCHGMINPLGFTLERFDAIGRLRLEENGHPIDCTGSYLPRTGPAVQFKGAQDLAHYLAGSDEAHAAFVEKMFQNLVKQPVRAYGPQALPDLQRDFAAQEYNIRKLLVEISTVAAMRQIDKSLSARSGGSKTWPIGTPDVTFSVTWASAPPRCLSSRICPASPLPSRRSASSASSLCSVRTAWCRTPSGRTKRARTSCSKRASNRWSRSAARLWSSTGSVTACAATAMPTCAASAAC
jgi:cytochrome c553